MFIIYFAHSVLNITGNLEVVSHELALGQSAPYTHFEAQIANAFNSVFFEAIGKKKIF